MSKNPSFHSVNELSLNLFAEKVYEHLFYLSEERASVREDERKIIARQVHDDLGQILLALKMDVFMINSNLSKNETNFSRVKLQRETQQIASKIDCAIEAVHKVIVELRPETLNHLGLRGALEWHAQEFQGRTGIPVETRFDHETITLDDPNRATAVLRIFQEALINIGRHARASRVETTFQQSKKFLMMQIKDNGCGINNSDLLKTTSFGLLGLKERVFLLQGDVEIQGVPNKGTTITVRIPLYL